MYKDMRKRKLRKDKENVVIVAYETVMDGESLKGILLVSSRLKDELIQGGGIGVLVYREKWPSKNGFTTTT